MIRRNDIVFAGVGILGVSLLAIYLMKNKKESMKEVDNGMEKIDKVEPALSIVKATPPNQIKKKYWLSRGSKGKEVERLQIWLLRNHGWKGNITQEFDQQTEALVKKVFKKDGLDRATYEKYQMGIPIHELIKTS